jgi:hypothetical protein
MLVSKQALLFLKKKQQKNFTNLGLGRCGATGPEEQKFFGSFFQKRTASSLKDFVR